MAYCRKCGKELSASESFCSACGTKVDGINFNDAVSSVKRSTVQLTEKVAQGIQDSNQPNKILSSYNNLGTAKPMFLVTVGALILNLILMFSDMLQINLFFSMESGSFVGLLNDLKDTVKSYGGSSSDLGELEYVIPMFNLGVVVIVVAIILTVLPILLGKEYSKKYISFNYIATIYNFLLYIITILVISDTSAYGSEIIVGFMTYAFLAETLATLIITGIFSSRLKQLKAQSAAPTGTQS